ncbi:MAG TPA: hypothetical protein PKK99_14370, partial [Bacteroidia bacterium]|nr:hypothetical protein [Bacteroidia bacterium]
MTELANQYKYFHVDSALLYAQKALTLARKIGFHQGEFQSLFMMGFVIDISGNYPRALELYLKALRIAEKYSFTRQRGEALNRLGIIYRETQNHSKSLFYHTLAKQLFDSAGYYDMSASAQVYLGKIYYSMGQPDSALHYALMASENIRRYNAGFMSCGNLQSLARIYSAKGNVQIALTYYQQSLAAGYSHPPQYFYNSISNLDIAKIYYKAQQMDSSLYYAQKSLEDAQKSNVGKRIAEAALFLSALYGDRNVNMALHYQKKALEATEKMNGFGNADAIQNQVSFDEDERQYELDTAQAAYQSKIKQFALLIGLGVFFLITFFLYRNNKQKHKANAFLKNQKEEISKQKSILEKTLMELRSTQSQLIQSEKMASLGEMTAGIAHEIQNPLNFVNNFSEVNKELLIELKDEVEKGNIEEVKAITNDVIENS